MRKSIPKKIRQQIYDKYNGRCAYCGCELEYKNMQVDHIEAVRIAEYHGKEPDNSIENYNPACRSCNFYKATFDLEEFRKNIESSLVKRLRRDFNYKMLIKYGMIHEDIKPVKFYFEREDGDME